MRIFSGVLLLALTTIQARRVSKKSKNLRSMEGSDVAHLLFMGGGENDDPVLNDLIDSIETAEKKENDIIASLPEAEKGSCWGYCDNGKCDWSIRGCKCKCNENWLGKCCTKMKTCGPDTKTCCPRENLKPQKRRCSNLVEDVRAGNTLVLGTADMGLDKNKRGMFWLTKQGAKSSLMSFARTNDGCGIADATTGGPSFTHDNPFRIRVAGDRTWSDGGGFDSGTFKAAAALDLVYNFIEEPKGKIVIVPQMTRSFFNIKVARWLMEFRADLMDHTKVDEHKSPYTTKPDGTINSVVWHRTSNAFGGRKELGGAAQYDLVQVLDEDGLPIQPAYDDFVKSCNEASESWEEDNDHPETQGGPTRTVYGRGVAEAADDFYYFRSSVPLPASE